jgi:hypothetical protein
MELMEPLLNAHDFSILKIRKDSWYITKNEHGTYGEFCDYILEVTVDVSTNVVVSCKINNVFQYLFPADKEELLRAFVEKSVGLSINNFCRSLILIQ